MDYRIRIELGFAFLILIIIAGNTWVLPHLTGDFDNPENAGTRQIMDDTEQKLLQMALKAMAATARSQIVFSECEIYEVIKK